MLDLIRTKIENYTKYLKETYVKSEKPLNNDRYAEECESIIQRMEFLQILIMEAAQFLADIKMQRDEMIQNCIIELSQDKLYTGFSTSTLNMYIKSKPKEHNFYINSLEEIIKLAKEQVSAYITILSYRKSQMTL